MASGKYSLRLLSALAFLCASTAAHSTDTSTEALPCAAPVMIMSTQSELPAVLGTVETDVLPLSAATTNPRPVFVSMPELLSREEMALLSESDLLDRIATIERAISSLFDSMPALLPAPSLTKNEAGCH